jgi:carboxymethylenebutenolidase
MGEDFHASGRWLKRARIAPGKVGAVGFCFGGVVNTLAVKMGADLAAGVPFYGAQPMAADAAKIKAPLLLNYAAMDDRIDAGIPAYEAALKAAGVPYTVYIYPGTQHGFHNDTTPRYDKAAAELAWQRTLEHFNKYLRA